MAAWTVCAGGEREAKVVDQSDSESGPDEALESEQTDEDDEAELEDQPTVEETGRRQKAPRVENASDGKPDQVWVRFRALR